MKKKILGILVCVLMIATAVLPIVGTMSDNKLFEEASADYCCSLQQIIGGSCLMSNWSEQAKLTASDGTDYDRFGLSVSIDDCYVVVGAEGDDDNGDYSGSAYVFKRDGTTWTEEAKLTASGGTDRDTFGRSVSIDGDYLIIGAHGDDISAGSAYVFKRSGTTWTQEAKLLASDGADYDYFGQSTSISGDYIIVGAYGDDSGTGSAYIFKRDGTTWTEQAKLTASDGTDHDDFGICVSIDGDYAVIGSQSTDSGTGSAYIFKRDGTTWTEEAKLLASDTDYDYFGHSVSINDNYVIVGAFFDDSKTGSAYIFKRDGTTWTEEAKLTASDGTSDDLFGASVSINDDYVIVSAYGDDSGTGSAYIFKRDGTTWTEEAKLTASDGAVDDKYGISTSIDGNYAIVGAFCDDSTGSAYVFKKSGPDLCCDGNLSWSNVEPMEVVFGNFSVKNNGDSELNWEVKSWPSWGSDWSFNPSSGIGLKPEDGWVTVQTSVKAPDEYGKTFTGKMEVVNTDDNDDSCEVDVSLQTNEDNQPPTVQITSPSSGATVSGTISIQGTAADSDGTVMGVEVKIDSGSWQNAVGTTSWSYNWDTTTVTNGQHTIYARSKDNDDVHSTEDSVTVTVDNVNQPPNKPSTPSGPTSGKTGTSYPYSSSTTDPNGDTIEYQFDWDDGTTSPWIGPLSSGQTASASHAWSSQRTYQVKVIARDEHGAESEWSDPLSVSMPKTKPYFNTPILKFLQQYPILYQLLQRFLRL